MQQIKLKFRLECNTYARRRSEYCTVPSDAFTQDDTNFLLILTHICTPLKAYGSFLTLRNALADGIG